VKRETAKVGGNQFESVTKALSYPSEIGDFVHHDCAAGLSYPPCLDSV
jgi:MinD-like ATPase involved in chromosome partitioning or flagellar assembly